MGSTYETFYVFLLALFAVVAVACIVCLLAGMLCIRSKNTADHRIGKPLLKSAPLFAVIALGLLFGLQASRPVAKRVISEKVDDLTTKVIRLENRYYKAAHQQFTGSLNDLYFLDAGLEDSLAGDAGQTVSLYLSPDKQVLRIKVSVGGVTSALDQTRELTLTASTLQ